MTTDVHDRLRRGLAEFAEAVPVDPPALAALTGAATPARTRRAGLTRWAVPAVAALAVALVVSVGFLVRPGGSPVSPGGPADRPSLPDAFAAHSMLTAPVSQAPLHRVIANYGWDGGGYGVAGQSVLLASDGDAYRLVDAADARGEGWPAPTLLAGDGTKVAVSDARGPQDDVVVVDVRSGRGRAYPLGVDLAVTLLAWSSDARYLAYASGPFHRPGGPAAPAPTPSGGALSVLDTETGQHRALAGTGVPASATDAAFSPDGRLLAVQQDTSEVVLLDFPAGTVARRVPLAGTYRLAGQAAWSPDGALLALHQVDPRATGDRTTQAIGYVAAAPGAPVTDRVTTATSVRFLGWRSPERLLVYGPEGDADVVTEVDRAGADPTRVSVVDRDGALDDRQIDFLQLAYTLLPDLVVRPAGAPDHGPWPTWLRVTVAVTTAVLLGGVALLVRQRRRRTDSRPA